MNFDIHAHYTGSLPSQFLYETFLNRDIFNVNDRFRSLISKIIQIKGIDVKSCEISSWLKKDLENLVKITTIDKFVEFSTFQIIYELIQLITKSLDENENYSLLRNGSKSICESYIREGVDGFSLRIGPGSSLEGTRQRLIATIEGFTSAKEVLHNNISSNITLTFIREINGGVKNVADIKTLNQILSLVKSDKLFLENIDTFDFCGYESADLSQTISFIKQIQKTLPEKQITVHIGEQFTNVDQNNLLDNIVSLIELGVKRIGHGVILWCPEKYLKNKTFASKRNRILKLLSENNVLLEICPTSNLFLTPIKKYSEINLKLLKRNAVGYSICTDNKNIFKTNLRREQDLIN